MKSSRKDKRRSYTCHYKLKVVIYAEQRSNAKAAEEYGVHRRRVQEWRNQKGKLMEQISQSRGDTKRLSGGGRRNTDRSTDQEKLEEKMINWINKRIVEGEEVNADLILKEAEKTKSTFEINLSWANTFLETQDYLLREKRKTDEKQTEKIEPKTYSSSNRKREHILKALTSKTYSIHDWLDGRTDELHATSCAYKHL